MPLSNAISTFVTHFVNGVSNSVESEYYVAPPSDDHSYAFSTSVGRQTVPEPQQPSLFRNSSATSSMPPTCMYIHFFCKSGYVATFMCILTEIFTNFDFLSRGRNQFCQIVIVKEVLICDLIWPFSLD